MKRIMAFIMIVLTVAAFSACKKEPVIGYDPEIPQEWIEEAEKEANRKETEVIRSTDFDGIWKLESTGEYYHVYNGHIFLLDGPDSADGNYLLWGTTAIVQIMDKEKAKEYEAGAKFEVGEQFQQYYNSPYQAAVEATTTVVAENRMKTVTADGKELFYTLVKPVDGWPDGYDM